MITRRRRKKEKKVLTNKQQQVVKVIAIAAADEMSKKWMELIPADDLIALALKKMRKKNFTEMEQAAIRVLLMVTFASRLAVLWKTVAEKQREAIWRRIE